MAASPTEQVLSVPPTQAFAALVAVNSDFLLKAAPSPNKYKTKRRQLRNDPGSGPSPPPASNNVRLFSSISRRFTLSASRPRSSSVAAPPRTPLSSFINWADTPTPTQSPRKPSLTSSLLSFVLATPLPQTNPKRQGRTFDCLPFTFTPSPIKHHEQPRNSSESTLVNFNTTRKSRKSLAFLNSDPYASSQSFFNHSPPPLTETSFPFSQPRQRSATTTSLHNPKNLSSRFSASTINLSTIAPKSKTLKLKAMASLSLSSTRSSSSGSSSSHSTIPTSVSTSASRQSGSRKVPEKIRPFTTSQLAQLDQLLGNPKAAKGKTPSSFTAPPPAPEDKTWKYPYVPLNGSAPSGTRSLGRDGQYQPPPPGPVKKIEGTGRGEVGRGNALPTRDEKGILWSGQEEMDEYRQLINATSSKRKAGPGVGKIDTSRKSSDGWKHFTPESACSFDDAASSTTTMSPMRSGSNASSFEVEYDEAIMVPEGAGYPGGRKVGQVITVPQIVQTTRGGDAFPVPSPQGGQLVYTNSAQAPGPSGRGGWDRVGRAEYFSDAFAPSPSSSYAADQEPPLSPTSVLPSSSSKSRAHRHSTSFAVGSTQLFSSFASKKDASHPNHAPSNLPPLPQTQAPPRPPHKYLDDIPPSPKSPGYLKPMMQAAYNGIRQASFSAGMPSTPPPMPKPPKSKDLKKKGSGLNVGAMFKKFGARA